MCFRCLKNVNKKMTKKACNCFQNYHLIFNLNFFYFIKVLIAIADLHLKS